MGYYVQGPALGKADYIVSEYNGVIVGIDEARAVASDIGSNLGVICVVNNGPFEAAGYMYSPGEFEYFADPEDRRKKTWVVMDKALAKELSGCKV